jgi:hypothetical protein
MQCHFVSIFLLIGWLDATSEFNGGGSSHFDASVAAFISNAIDYYKVVHGGPPEAEVSQVILNSVKRLGSTHQSGILEKVINSVLPGMTEVIISEPSRYYLESALYVPFHKLIGCLRLASKPEYTPFSKWYVQMNLAQLVAFVELFGTSSVQVGSYEYFAGLEEYVRALYPNQLSMSRSLTIELVETNLLNIIMKDQGWLPYRSYTISDQELYSPDLLKIEDFIAQGVPADADTKAKALSVVEEYISLVRDSWDPKASKEYASQSLPRMRIDFQARIQDLASQVPSVPEKN